MSEISVAEGRRRAMAILENCEQQRLARPDPWDACLDVDPFTGQPEADHIHGESCDQRECCE